MKYTKINGVPLEICTAEAKIAYNLSFSWHDIIKEKYKNAINGLEKNKIIREYTSKLVYLYSQLYGVKYNIDAIYCCLGHGLEEYINLKYSILTSFEEIGQIFKSEYLNRKGAKK